MAKLLKKAMLYAGRTYHSPDGKVTVTPERLKHWAEGFSQLTANNYAVPMDWDHAKDLADASPVAMSKFKQRSSKNTVGKLAGFNVAADGSHAELLLDITDPTARGRAERNEVYVSPVIFEKWKDGANNEYSDVITHVDIVNHPVDNSQGPFVSTEAGTLALGIRMGLAGGVYRMSENPFDEEEDDEETPEGNDGGSDTIPEAEVNKDMPVVEGDDKIAVAIVAHLEQLGVSLPAEWTFKSDAAAEILLTGLKTALKVKQTAEAEKSDEEDDDSFGGSEMGKISDPGYAAMSLQARTALNFAENQHRSGLVARLDKAFAEGKCSAQFRDELSQGIPGIRLSLDGDGKHSLTSLEERLAVVEQNPAGTFWSDEQKTQNRHRMSISQPGSHQVLSTDADDEAYVRKLTGLAQ